MKLTIVGSVALDTIQTPSGKVNEVLGGSAYYASLVSRNFCKTGIVGVVGQDFPQEYIDMLNGFNIDTEGLEIAEGKTFRWVGKYDNLNQAITLDTQLNVFADFDPIIPESYKSTECLFLGNIHPKLQRKVLDQLDHAKIIAIDTMNYWIESCKDDLLDVIKDVDILFINEDEVKQLTGKKNVFQAADAALEYGVKLVVIKQGEYGAFAISEAFTFFAPVYPVRNVVDPTGAGDSFAGGFMGYIAGKNDFSQHAVKLAMIHGSVMASFNIQDFSMTELKKVKTKDIEKRMKYMLDSMSIIKNAK